MVLKYLIILWITCMSVDCCSFDSKIINGSYVPIWRFPYQVSIHLFNDHICGGVIIKPDTILTVAHCVYYRDPEDITIKAGYECLEHESKLYEVRKIIVHENYVLYTKENDIAVLKLKENLRLFYRIEPAELYEGPFPRYTEAYVTGWGYMGERGFPKYLRCGTVNLISFEECQKEYSKFDKQIFEGMLCAYDKSVDACKGDSGGPLTLRNPRKLIGLVSWGRDCAVNPGVYTNVTYYINWIKNTYDQ